MKIKPQKDLLGLLQILIFHLLSMATIGFVTIGFISFTVFSYEKVGYFLFGAITSFLCILVSIYNLPRLWQCVSREIKSDFAISIQNDTLRIADGMKGYSINKSDFKGIGIQQCFIGRTILVIPAKSFYSFGVFIPENEKIKIINHIHEKF